MKHLFLILSTLFVFGLSPVPVAQAALIPCPKEVVHKKKKQRKFKKRKKKRFKKLEAKLQQHRTYSLRWLLIGWYIIATTLLIIGLAMAFPPLWIAAIVLLCIPIGIAIIFGFVFLFILLL